jgi:predicted O-methyltransferase YrrM
MSVETQLKSTYKWIKFLYTSFLKSKLKNKLNKRNHFVYRYDWTSKNYDNWEKWFSTIKGKENLRFLEIGSQEGRSVVWFLTNILTHQNSTLTCVDPMHDTNEVIFNHNIKVSGAANKVTLIKQYSEEALVYLKENNFDFIYIDGSHDAMNVLADSIYSWELLKKDGLLLFDDYLWEPDKPKHKRCQYPIDLFLKIFKDQIEVIHKGYQVLVKKIV